jgi:inosine-uridine nucleoside N-ribohydrolase
LVGTRGSALALAQTETVRGLLEAAHGTVRVSVRSISTKGDKILDVALSKIGDKALFTKEHEARLTGKVGEMVRALLTFYGNFHKQQYGWDGSPIHDAVAVAHVSHPDLVETKRRGVKIDTESELSRGRTLVDLWGRAQWEPNCDVGVDIRADDFLDVLVERLNTYT